MFKALSTAYYKPAAKSVSLGVTHLACHLKTVADGGHVCPTILLPRLPAVSVSFFPNSIQSHQNAPYTTLPHRRSSQSSKMASTKDYRLLCLENPLLGEHPDNAFHTRMLPNGRTHYPSPWCNTPSCVEPYLHISPGDRAPKQPLPLERQLTRWKQTSRPSVTRLCSRSMASRRTTPSWPRRSTRASSRTCSPTTTPS